METKSYINVLRFKFENNVRSKRGAKNRSEWTGHILITLAQAPTHPLRQIYYFFYYVSK